ncbi:MAG: COX15/CtaA family protein [Thermomicrobiales bacterium]
MRSVWESIIRRLAVVAAAGMLLVLLMGATVTTTESGEGCGRSWPLCHGEFIPAYTLDTAIEYSHRFVTGIEGIIIAVVALGALILRWRDRALRFLVALMVGSLLLQAGMGAAAVMWPQQPAVMASHFGISLVCFAATVLVARVLGRPAGERVAPGSTGAVIDGPVNAALATGGLASTGVAPAGVGPGPSAAARLSPAPGGGPVPVGFRVLLGFTLVAVVAVAYLGAYMRHTESSLACAGWPGCDGRWQPSVTDPAGIVVSHRLAAMASVFLVASLAWWAFRLRDQHPGLLDAHLLALIVILAQALLGAAVVYSGLDYLMTLAHTGLMAILFVCLCDNWPILLPARNRAARPVTSGYPRAVTAR